MFQRFSAEAKSLLNSIVELCWFMRGSVTYEEMMLRTPVERQIISEFIEKRLDSQKKSMYPVY